MFLCFTYYLLIGSMKQNILHQIIALNYWYAKNMSSKMLTKFQAKKHHIICLKWHYFDGACLNTSVDFRNYFHTWLHLLIFSSWRSGFPNSRWLLLLYSFLSKVSSHKQRKSSLYLGNERCRDPFMFCLTLFYNPLHPLLHLANPNAIPWLFNMSFFLSLI